MSNEQVNNIDEINEVKNDIFSEINEKNDNKANEKNEETFSSHFNECEIENPPAIKKPRLDPQIENDKVLPLSGQPNDCMNSLLREYSKEKNGCIIHLEQLYDEYLHLQVKLDNVSEFRQMLLEKTDEVTTKILEFNKKRSKANEEIKRFKTLIEYHDSRQSTLNIRIDEKDTSKERVKYTCSICLETLSQDLISLYEQKNTLPCGHMFHKKCILEWFSKQEKDITNFSCPTCRNPVFGEAYDKWKNIALIDHKMDIEKRVKYNKFLTNEKRIKEQKLTLLTDTYNMMKHDLGEDFHSVDTKHSKVKSVYKKWKDEK